MPTPEFRIVRRGRFLRAVHKLLEVNGEMTASEVGLLYHAEIGLHDRTDTCQWCRMHGARVIAELILRGEADLTEEMTVAWKPGTRNVLLNRSHRRGNHDG